MVVLILQEVLIIHTQYDLKETTFKKHSPLIGEFRKQQLACKKQLRNRGTNESWRKGERKK